MKVEKICEICGAKFTVIYSRRNTAKYCSVACQRESLRAKPNLKCKLCGKEFHQKESHLKRYGHSFGNFCSRDCLNEYRKIGFAGTNNHQFGLKGNLNASFRGDEIERKNNKLLEVCVYAPNRIDADACGRVKKHRLIVEENWESFPADAFDVDGGQHILKDRYVVHHIDGNHSNNDLSNLMVVTKAEHRSLHNKQQSIIRDKATGRITGIIQRSTGR